MFGGLSDLRELHTLDRVAGDSGEREPDGNLESGGRTQTRANRDIAGYQQVCSGQPVAAGFKDKSDALNVFAPIGPGTGLAIVKIDGHYTFEIDRLRNYGPVRSGRRRDIGCLVDGCGQDKAVVIVRMFTDQIYPPGCAENSRSTAVFIEEPPF